MLGSFSAIFEHNSKQILLGIYIDGEVNFYKKKKYEVSIFHNKIEKKLSPKILHVYN